jgi:hypothetical protein
MQVSVRFLFTFGASIHNGNARSSHVDARVTRALLHRRCSDSVTGSRATKLLPTTHICARDPDTMRARAMHIETD